MQVQIFRSVFFHHLNQNVYEPPRASMSTCCVRTRVQMIRHEGWIRLWPRHLFQPQFTKPINQSLIPVDTQMQIIFHSEKHVLSFSLFPAACAPPFAGNMSNKLNNSWYEEWETNVDKRLEKIKQKPQRLHKEKQSRTAEIMVESQQRLPDLIRSKVAFSAWRLSRDTED